MHLFLSAPLSRDLFLFLWLFRSQELVALYHMVSVYLYLFSTEMLRIIILLFPFQALAVSLQPIKLSCSRFTTTMDIILLSLLSIKIKKTQCITATTTDPLLVRVLVGLMTSSYKTTFSSTQHRTPIAGKHILFPRDIQLVTVGFSLEVLLLLLLTLKYFMK